MKHFLSTGEALPQPSVAERVAIAKEHLQKSLEIKGDHVGILEMRRHMTNYFKGLPDFKSTRLKLVTSLDTAELFATLDEIACRWGGYDLSEAVPAPLSHNPVKKRGRNVCGPAFSSESYRSLLDRNAVEQAGAVPVAVHLEGVDSAESRAFEE